MRRIVGYIEGKPIYGNIYWSDHYLGCEKCRRVELDHPATFVLACAEGSPLLMEKCIDIQRPKQKEKEKKVKEWARKTGVFKL